MLRKLTVNCLFILLLFSMLPALTATAQNTVMQGESSTWTASSSSFTLPSGTTWAVYQNTTPTATLVATSASPASWTVTLAGNFHSPPATITVSPPSNAALSTPTYTVYAGTDNPAEVWTVFTDTFSVVSNQPAVSTVVLNPTSVIGATSGSGTSTATVTLAANAPSGGETITPSCGSYASVSPASFSIGAGSKTGTFTVTGLHVTAPESVTVTATNGAGSSASAGLSVVPWLATLAMPCSCNSIQGGNSAQATVYLSSPAPSGGITVALASSVTSAATVPATATIPAGASSAQFTITSAIQNTDTDTDITATYDGVVLKQTLQVGPLLNTLTVLPGAVTAGGTMTGTLNINGPASSNLTFQLQSSDPSVASVPATVTINQGYSTGTFTVSTSTVTANTFVTLTVWNGWNTVGAGAWVNVAVPSAPTGFTGTYVSSPAKNNLSWNSSSGATSYNIYRADSSGQEISYVTGITATSYSDTTLASGVNYYYKVTAVGAGGEGPRSSEVIAGPHGSSAPPGPAAPMITADPSSGQIKLNWAVVSGATSYNVYRGTTPGGESSTAIGTGTTSAGFGYYIDTSVTSGQTYYYQVASVSSSGTGALSKEVSAVSGTSSLGTPTLTATAADSQVMLTWPAVSGATSYNVYSSTPPSQGQPTLTLLAVGVTNLYYVVTGQTDGTPVYFAVTAVSASGEGASHSTIQSATPSAGTLLPAPTSPAAIANLASIALSWNNVPGASSYNVYRATVPGGECATPYATVTTGTSFVDGACENYTTYYYTIAGVCTSGAVGTSSTEVNALIIPQPTVSAVPGNTQVTLTWPALANATTYNVYRSTTSGGEGATPVVSAIGSATYTDTGLTNGTTYYYTVAGVNSNGVGVYSSEIASTPGVVQITGAWATPGLIPPWWVGTPTTAGATDICTPVTFTATGTFNGSSTFNGSPVVLTYTWAYGDGLSSSPSTSAVSHTYSATGSETVGVTATYNAFGHTYQTAAATNITETVNNPPAPAAPTGLGVTVDSADLKLNWTAPVSSPVSECYTYSVYRSTSSGTELQTTPIATGLSSTTTVYVDSTAVRPTLYYYKVVAVNAGGTSAPTNEVSATLTCVVINPITYTITGPTPYINTCDTVTFAATDTDYCNSSQSTASFTWAFNDGSGVTSTNGYPSGLTAPAHQFAAAGQYTVTLTGTDEGTTWTQSYPVTVTQFPQLGPPSSVTAVAASPTSVVVSWGSVANATGYSLSRSINGGAQTVVAANISAGTLTYTDSSLAPATPVCYYVIANDYCVPGPQGSACVTTPDFLLAVNPVDITIPAGGWFDAEINVLQLTGTQENVNLMLTGNTNGIITNLSWPETSTVADLNVGGATVGDYNLTLTGSTSAASLSTPVRVHVVSPTSTFNTYSFRAYPSVVTITHNTAADVNFAVTQLGVESPGTVHDFYPIWTSGTLPTGVNTDDNDPQYFSDAGPTGLLSNNTGLTNSTLVGTDGETGGAYVATAHIGDTQGTEVEADTQVGILIVGQDFLIDTNENQVSVAPGVSSANQITVTPIGGSTDTITLAVSNLPTGITASLQSSSITFSTIAGVSTALTFTIDPTAVPAGRYPVLVTGTDTATGKVHGALVYVNVTTSSEFNLSANTPSSLLDGGVFTTIANPVNGYTGSVVVAVAPQHTAVTGGGFAPSLTASWFWPNSNSLLNGPGLVPAGTPLETEFDTGSTLYHGVDEVRIFGWENGTGQYDGIVHVATVPLVSSNQFDVQLAPAEVTLNAQGVGSTAVTVIDYAGYNGTPVLTTTGVPSGLTATFSSTTSPATLSLVGGAIAGGQYQFQVVGTDSASGITHSALVTVNVPPGTMALTTPNGNTTIGLAGETSTMNVGVVGSFNFGGTVALSAACPTLGVSSGSQVVTPASVTLAPGSETASAYVAIPVPAGTASGPNTVTVSGVSGSLSPTCTYTLTVPAPSFTLYASPQSINVSPGSGASTLISITSQYGFAGSAALSASSNAGSGLTETFVPSASASPDAPAQLMIAVSPVLSPGTYTVTVTGVSGSISDQVNIAVNVLSSGNASGGGAGVLSGNPSPNPSNLTWDSSQTWDPNNSSSTSPLSSYTNVGSYGYTFVFGTVASNRVAVGLARTGGYNSAVDLTAACTNSNIIVSVFPGFDVYSGATLYWCSTTPGTTQNGNITVTGTDGSLTESSTALGVSTD